MNLRKNIRIIITGLGNHDICESLRRKENSNVSNRTEKRALVSGIIIVSEF